MGPPKTVPTLKRLLNFKGCLSCVHRQACWSQSLSGIFTVFFIPSCSSGQYTCSHSHNSGPRIASCQDFRVVLGATEKWRHWLSFTVILIVTWTHPVSNFPLYQEESKLDPPFFLYPIPPPLTSDSKANIIGHQNQCTQNIF